MTSAKWTYTIIWLSIWCLPADLSAQDTVINGQRFSVVRKSDVYTVYSSLNTDSTGSVVEFRITPYGKSRVMQSWTSYENGRRHGEEKWWHQNGQLAGSAIWKDGKVHKGTREFYESGIMKSKSLYRNHKLIRTKRWYPSGARMSVSNYLDKQPCDSRGQTKECTFVHGRQISWNKDGSLSEKGHARKGRKYGRCRSRNEIRHFNKDGLSHGRYKYFLNNTLRTKGRYRNGLKHKKWTYWKDGIVGMVLHFDKGILIQKGARNWNKDSLDQVHLILSPRYDPLINNCPDDSVKVRARPDGYYKIYNAQHDIVMDGNFKDGCLFDGRRMVYDRNNQLQRILIFKSGVFRGFGIMY